MSSIVSPTCIRMTIVSSVTREFRTRTAPFSNWTRGTVSGKLKRFVSTSAFYSFTVQIKTASPNTSDTTCRKKVFNKQHFLQDRGTKYNHLSIDSWLPATRAYFLIVVES